MSRHRASRVDCFPNMSVSGIQPHSDSGFFWFDRKAPEKKRILYFVFFPPIEIGLLNDSIYIRSVETQQTPGGLCYSFDSGGARQPPIGPSPFCRRPKLQSSSEERKKEKETKTTIHTHKDKEKEKGLWLPESSFVFSPRLVIRQRVH